MNLARLLIDSDPLPGTRNMAVDETLLESALSREVATVRVYQWSAPTVSLGYFQDADEFECDPQWLGLAAVRRLSGGGAILHDREITYSVTIPPSHPITAQPSRLYVLVHDALLQVLSEHGIAARMRGTPSIVNTRSPIDPSSTNHQPSTINPSPVAPFLCFGRGDPNDIVLGGHKIVGSAQRRRRGAILQHGSILLARSPHAADFPGITELTSIKLNRTALSEQVGAAIVDALGGGFGHSKLDDNEKSRATELEHTRYATLRWRDRDKTVPSPQRVSGGTP